jgi:hypothetical protein
MDLLQALLKDPSLAPLPSAKPLIRQDCADEGLCVEFDINIDRSRILILDVDLYYKRLHMGNQTPKTVDCVIVQKCQSGGYLVYLVELKGHRSVRDIDNYALEEKFETTLYDFIGERLGHHFNDDAYKIRYRLILGAGSPDKNHNTYSLDFLLGLRLWKFAGQTLGINGHPRNPLIRPC